MCDMLAVHHALCYSLVFSNSKPWELRHEHWTQTHAYSYYSFVHGFFFFFILRHKCRKEARTHPAIYICLFFFLVVYSIKPNETVMPKWLQFIWLESDNKTLSGIFIVNACVCVCICVDLLLLHHFFSSAGLRTTHVSRLIFGLACVYVEVTGKKHLPPGAILYR